ncbi:hypothetical protein ncot_03240 [Nocardioides sp. JQ2195]|uniref:ATP-grasp domain-containing protein n=1 Tax=Nocardioides sp. JQ2195 TaxID=2592334 RepID=UPI00143E8FA3|nr:hypothetical protein [Nocardioides sp. JQ2195]QIX25713.1 hypothetical protein ncot_03240 [Nocardioides sp. JQ2195]
MTRALLVTFSLLPDGEHGGEALVPALAERGVESRWVSWDDPEVDWAAADVIAVRSTWDYHRRHDDFMAWARRVDQLTTLLNGAAVFEWNADKSYLIELGERVAVVPTGLLDDSNLRGGLEAALDRHNPAVLKGRVSAAGVGVVVVEAADDQRLSGLTVGPWVVQPLVESVRTEGEASVFVIGGEVVSQVNKLPGDGEIRVHEEYGGRSMPVPIVPEHAELALAAVAAAEAITGAGLDYARVDMMRLADGTLAVSELELIEPGLYLDLLPGNADPFADLVARTGNS